MELPLGGPALRHYTQSRPRPHRQKLNYRPSRPQETIIESENEVLEFMGRVDEGVEEFFTKRVLPTETLEVARAEKEKDKDRVKERDKENEKEKAKEPPSAVTGESAVQETPVSGAPLLRGEAVPPRRALREGKSQSLILLSGSAAAGTTNARNTAKKQFEGQHSFEQKLHLMLQRIGVSKAQPGETQNQEGEMKKAESEADPITPDTAITSSSSLASSALPPTTSTSSTTSPRSTDHMDSSSTSTITHPTTPSPADISAPSTSSSETNPTDTTTTTSSLNRADTTSTPSSAAAISSPLLTDSDQTYTDNISTTISDMPTTDNSSATTHHLTSPASSNDSAGQDNDLQASPEERSSVEPAASDKEREMVQKSEKAEMDESKKVAVGGKESENEKDEPALINSEVMSKEMQEESVKPEEDPVKTEVETAEPASGRDRELSRDEGVIDGQKQEETKSASEK
ncbi:Capping protein [Collichthys lucidus]|uniref:Capping protein n=1 Tax=Collichthys lucidus TaxID=240159 RepID=A0A4V6ANR9_COLLU|nr:Capping protein [Collichthys lucidus]